MLINSQSIDNYSRRVLTEMFGVEIGTKLFGAAIKTAMDYGFSVDDIAQDMAIAALDVKKKYGFVHISTVVHGARDIISKTNRYADFARKNVPVESIVMDNEGVFSGGHVLFADKGFNWADVDRALCVEKALEEIDDDTDRAITKGYMAGYGPTEIGKSLGIHHSTVCKRKKRNLTKAFQGAF